eukprot:CAMPEP_0182517890 /NCGR_PEP_ID=MMETSP1321-20130603/43131_1 /TAXON_ID=91990 /ORGANISM="Bolidomonas sp., Strain RCC1657" /LENGTH=61 /DNA_ID=CAMNT_0024725673 /DNA_START=143 /DNA_END=329 /DNA_ORIENTATION=-
MGGCLGRNAEVVWEVADVEAPFEGCGLRVSEVLYFVEGVGEVLEAALAGEGEETEGGGVFD